ncbi:single-stranded DNA-binding protein [Microbacterium sp. No. 7]|uniref:single-stranded DNA-binding protein n=1 Tax=Microbacterium sp. No. 7 TaxID=1714373 RepID=UPI0006D06CAC|nr:single-stranded DNA-binding protein [Microbacterium sp. No. 7]ALJ22074.1 hypothetical protein AOA12_20145 [Microbacterium sp. No. 7]
MTSITIRGNMVAPVELRFTKNGLPVGNVTVAVNRGRDDKKETDFHRITLWGSLAENAAHLEKGTSVIVVGRLESRTYEDRDNVKRTAWEINADAFGPDLRFATAQVTRAVQGSGNFPQNYPAQQEPWTPPASGADGWVNPNYGENAPF